jgi:hypothetical protein
VRLFGRRKDQEAVGGLPADGKATVAGVSLSGRRVRADLEGPGAEVLWRTDGPPPPGAWERLADAFPRTGLWPLLLPDERLDLGYVEPDWPETLSPVELGGPGDRRNDDAVREALAMLTEVHSLGLVPVERPADILSATGWTGAVNSFTPAELTPYLRSWEERFDALPVALGFDTLHLAIRRAPADADETAAEVYAFCPDIIDQGIGSVEELAATMIPSPYWYFWWD